MEADAVIVVRPTENLTLVGQVGEEPPVGDVGLNIQIEEIAAQSGADRAGQMGQPRPGDRTNPNGVRVTLQDRVDLGRTVVDFIESLS